MEPELLSLPLLLLVPMAGLPVLQLAALGVAGLRLSPKSYAPANRSSKLKFQKTKIPIQTVLTLVHLF